MLIFAFGRPVDPQTGRSPGVVACPACGAAKEAPCVTPRGKAAKRVHIARVERADRLTPSTPEVTQ